MRERRPNRGDWGDRCLHSCAQSAAEHRRDRNGQQREGSFRQRDGDVAFHHRHSPVPDPRELVPELPEAWSALVLSLLAKSPQDRPASAAIVGERLAQLSQGGPR